MRRPLLFLGGAQYLSVFKVEQLRALAFSLGWLAFLSPPLADYLWPYIAAPGILGEGSLTPVAPRGRRKRSTMEGAGQHRANRVTGHLEVETDGRGGPTMILPGETEAGSKGRDRAEG